MPVDQAQLSNGISQALQQGYSPDEVLSHLKGLDPQMSSGIDQATSQGYNASQILDHLRQGPGGQPGPQSAVSGQPQPSNSDAQANLNQRIQLGMGTRSPSGQRETAPVNPAHAEALAKAGRMVTEAQNAPTVPQAQIMGKHTPLLNRALGVANIATGLPQLAQTAEKVGRSGSLATPGLALDTAMSLPVGHQAALLRKIPGVGPALDAAGRMIGPLAKKAIPTVYSAGEKLASRLKSWAYDVPVLSHAIMSRTASHAADTHAAYNEIKTFGDELMSRHKLSEGELSRVADAMDTGKNVEQLMPNERNLFDELRPISKAITANDVKQGTIDVSKEWYLTHIYAGGKAKGFLRQNMKTPPTALHRSFDSYQDLANTQAQLTQELEQKGISVKQALAMPDAELKAAGFNPKVKGTLSLVPIKNPIRSVQAQMLASRMADLTKKNITSLATMQDEKGIPLFQNFYEPGRTKVDSTIFNKMTARSMKTGDKTLVKFFDKDAYVLKQHAGNVNRLLGSGGDVPTVIKEIKEINRATKFLRFFNPAVHNINEFSNAVQYFRGDMYKALGIPGKQFAKDPNKLAEAISDGFETQKLFDLKKGVAKDFGVVMNKFKSSIPYLTDTMDTIQTKFTNPALWNHVDHIGLSVYAAAKDKFIQQGMDPKTAGQSAVTIAHDVIGKMTNYTTMAMFKNPSVNALFNFIPSWINTSLRKYIGAIAPAQAFQHLPEEARKALQVEYQHNLIHGAVLGNLITQRLNFALSGHSTLENTMANKPSFAHPFGRIEAVFNGQLHTMDIPIMGSLTVPPRILNSLYQATQGKPAAAMGMMQPITSAPLAYGMEAYRSHDPRAAAGAAARQMSPLTELSDPRQSMGAVTLNSVLPVRLQKADPRSDAVLKVWNLYKADNKFQIIGQQEPWKDDLDKAIQAKDKDLVRKIMQAHYTGHEPDKFYQNRKMKNERPNTYVIGMIKKSGKLEHYLSQLKQSDKDSIKQKLLEENPQGLPNQ